MDLLGKAMEMAHPLVENIFNFEEKKKDLKRKFLQLKSMEADVIVELENAEMQYCKKSKNEVQHWLSDVGRLTNEIQSIEQEAEQGGWSILLGKHVEKKTEEVKELIDQRGRFQGELVLDVHDNCGETLLAPKLVGLAFETNKEEIWECLMRDEFLSIGIYGMGGVGKTTLATHIHNELLERQNSFQSVYWITMSHDFSIYRSQNQIAEAIGFDLSKEDDEKKRAAKLTKALFQRRRFVIILDDLWTPFSLENVGIPVGINGCKLILTTRSLDVCWKMGCQMNFKVEPLSEEESWNLFMEKLGQTIPSEFERIAKSIARECAGLPLGIVIIAGSMRGVSDVCEWRNALRELQESKVKEGDMQYEVFRVLKFSYNRLTETALQQCFLYCALYPEDHKIKREELIEYLIVEGVIVGGSRQIKFDEGHTMLNRLEKVCLLESVMEWGDRCVKMHDLIRDMAIQIMEVDHRVMVKAGRQLVDIPHWKNQAKGLTRVSLMYCNIIEIPSGCSPECPNLSTLLLRGNKQLQSIADSFFDEIHGLKVLDLSFTGIQALPGCISHFEGLRALLLRGCSRLKSIPSLAQLRTLEKLDISYTKVEEVPQGIELLCKLMYLDISNTEIAEVPIGILPKLSCLQVLILDSVKADEIAPLMKLETLECVFYNVGEFNSYTSSKIMHNFSKYYLVVSQFKHPDNVLSRGMKVAYFDDCSMSEGEDALLLPKDVQCLDFFHCSIQIRSLCLKNATELKSLTITSCNGLECLFSLSCSPSVFLSLEDVYVSDLKDLQFLFSREEATAPQPAPTLLPPHGTFSLLKKFYMWGCPSMKKLFHPGLFSNLQNLEEISVHYCKNMEVLIDVEEQQESHNSHHSMDFTLPKLQSFSLSNLPELESICGGKMICQCLSTVYVNSCLKLKRMPLSLLLLHDNQPSPLPSLQMIKVYPEVWWESVKLEHPDAKNVLLPLCHFSQF